MADPIRDLSVTQELVHQIAHGMSLSMDASIRRGLAKRLGKGFDVNALRGRLSATYNASGDWFYLDGSLFLHIGPVTCRSAGNVLTFERRETIYG